MIVPTMTYPEILKEVFLDLEELKEKTSFYVDRRINSNYGLFKETYRRNGNKPFQLKPNKNSVIVKSTRKNKWILVISDISIYKRDDYQYSCIRYIITNKNNGGREVLCPCTVPDTNLIFGPNNSHTAILRFEAHLFRRFKERYLLKQYPNLNKEDLSFEKIVNMFFTFNEFLPFVRSGKDFDEVGNVKTLIIKAKTQTGILLGEADLRGGIRYKTFITEDMLKDFQEDLKPGGELDRMLNEEILDLY